MPNARKVIFSSHVIPLKSIEMEETSVRQTEYMDSPGKHLGGKGTVTVNSTQWGDGWCSMSHERSTWADADSNWNTLGITWSGTIGITTTETFLSSDASDCAFLYVKNLGKRKIYMSLNGDTSSGGVFYIVIPGGGSVALRGTANLDCNDIFLKSDGGTNDVEYVIAKE